MTTVSAGVGWNVHCYLFYLYFSCHRPR